MNPRRLRWRGAGQQRALLLELQRQLGLWLQAWSVDPELLSLNSVEPQSAVSSDRRWMKGSGKTGSAWLGASVAQLEALGGLLAKASTQDTLGLGMRVGDRALRALLTQWVGGSAAHAEVLSDSIPGSEEMQARFGGFRFVVEGPGFTGTLIVDSQLCDHWVPVNKPKMSPLLARDSALSEESVTLQVLLDLGQARLAETHGLQVGDVLVSSTPLDSSFYLSHPDSRRLALGHLFRTGEQRAFQLEAANTLSKTS